MQLCSPLARQSPITIGPVAAEVSAGAQHVIMYDEGMSPVCRSGFQPSYDGQHVQ